MRLFWGALGFIPAARISWRRCFQACPRFWSSSCCSRTCPLSEGLTSVVMQGGAAGPARPTCCTGHLPPPHHTNRGHCPFHTGLWNIFPVNLHLGSPEHRWRNCTYSQGKSKPWWEFPPCPRHREAPQEIPPITGNSEVLVQLCR